MMQIKSNLCCCNSVIYYHSKARPLLGVSGIREVSQVMISRWKSEFLEAGPLVFTKAKSEDTKTLEAANEKLYTEIGRQEIEFDFLKKVYAKLGK